MFALKKQTNWLTCCKISVGFSSAGGSDPQLSTRDRSFPVPIGRIQTSGIGWMFISKAVFRIHPIVPSPPATRIWHCRGLILATSRRASLGPFDPNSVTCIGCKKPRNNEITSEELLSPDLEFATKRKKRKIFLKNVKIKRKSVTNNE